MGIPGGGAIAARGVGRCSPKTRVLALSAGDDRETVLEVLEAGADGFLMKGSPTETILTSIERAPLPLLVGAPAIEQATAA